MAFGPLMESEGHRFHQTILMKKNIYFKSWQVSFDSLKSYAVKLIDFHPHFSNISVVDRQVVANTESWLVLSELLNATFPNRFQISRYYGYVCALNFGQTFYWFRFN